MSYLGDEEWDYERRHRGRPSPHRMQTDARRSQHFLNPGYDTSLYRTRSQGHAPQPVINVYNDMMQDANASMRSSSRSPPYPPSPDYRGRRSGDRGRLGDELADEIADLALETRRMNRSRSRGRSDAGPYAADFYDYDRRRRQLDEERERIKTEYEIQRLKEEAKRKADEDAAKAEKKRIIEEWERKQREDEDERKSEEKRIREKVEREKREAEDKEKKEWDEFLLKQKAKDDKKKADDKKKEEDFEDEMRKRLARFGYPPDQIDVMVKEEVKKNTTTTYAGGNSLTAWKSPGAPVYAKVHKDYLSVDTLRYFQIPYEIDRRDPNYIIILREMDKYETEVLFEHTKRLRGGKLLLEPAKDKPKYAWYRKRDRSSSRVKKLGILEIER